MENNRTHPKVLRQQKCPAKRFAVILGVEAIHLRRLSIPTAKVGPRVKESRVYEQAVCTSSSFVRYLAVWIIRSLPERPNPIFELPRHGRYFYLARKDPAIINVSRHRKYVSPDFMTEPSQLQTALLNTEEVFF